jgi:hypothetical protein
MSIRRSLLIAPALEEVKCKVTLVFHEDRAVAMRINFDVKVASKLRSNELIAIFIDVLRVVVDHH